MFLAGRGAGKTRSGAEWIRDNVRLGIKRIGLIAPTAADSRDVMVEGSSGILEVCWEYDRDINNLPIGKPLYPSIVRVDPRAATAHALAHILSLPTQPPMRTAQNRPASSGREIQRAPLPARAE